MSYPPNGNGQPPGYPGAPPQYQQPAPAYGQPPGYPGAPAPTAYQQQPHMQLPGAPQRMPSLSGFAAGGDGARFLPDVNGDHVVEIADVKIGPRQDGDLRFELTFTVVESTVQGAVGQSYNWYVPFRTKFDWGPEAIKGWMCKAMELLHPGTNAAVNWDDRIMSYLTDPATQIRGTRWHCNVWMKEKQDRSGSISKLKWEALAPGQSLGLVAQAPPPAAPPQQGPMFPPPGAGYQPPAAPQQGGGPPPGWPQGLAFPGGGGR
jgi:hypothetical protein